MDGRTTDGRTTDGRTTDAGVTGILIAHLGAFGSGELKICPSGSPFVRFFYPTLTLVIDSYIPDHHLLDSFHKFGSLKSHCDSL